MPRYFFNVHDGQDFPDEEGAELASLAAARNYAARYAGTLLQDRTEEFWTGSDWRMDVTDEHGLMLFCLMFAAVDAPSIAPGADGQS